MRDEAHKFAALATFALCMGLASAGCWEATLVTEGVVHPVGAPLSITLQSHPEEGHASEGCNPIGFERWVDGRWLDEPARVLCVWGGYSQEIGPYESFLSEADDLEAERWRAVTEAETLN